MDNTDLDKLWSDPANWKYGIYRCPQDPRVIVPKRIKWMGWTMNFARPSAIPVMLLIIAAIVAPVWVLPCFGVHAINVLLGAILVVVLGVTVLCYYMSSSRR